MIRRLAAMSATGLVLAVTAVGPTANAAPIAPAATDTLPQPWSSAGTDFSFVRGPAVAPSGTGSLEFQYLTETISTPAPQYVFDTWIDVPQGLTSRLILTLNSDQGFTYYLTTDLTTGPGWTHYQLGGDTVFHVTDAEFNPKGDHTWAELSSGGTISRAQITLDDGQSGLSGIPIRGWLDLLDTNGSTWDFEPVQQPTIGATATTVIYGQSVTITGAVDDDTDTPLAGVPAVLWSTVPTTGVTSDLDTDTTSASGRLADVQAPTISTTYHWTSLTGRVSPDLVVKVAPRLKAKAPSSVARGKKLVVSGSAAPLTSGRVTLMRSGTSKPLGTATIKPNGTYALSVTAPRGTYLVWTRTAAVPGYVATSSASILTTVH